MIDAAVPPSPLCGPLHIDVLSLPATDDGAAPPGRIGMTHCPGRCRPDGRGRDWRRDLAQDVAAIRAAGFGTVLSLVDDAELASLGAARLPQALQQSGLRGLRFAIADFGVPDAQALAAWRDVQAQVLARLQSGESVLVHCAAGLGRTGTMVAVLLKALGDAPDVAIDRVRRTRPGTIETEAQARFVHDFDPAPDRAGDRAR
ncbi:MAG: cyclin-dependent kinase inhibitor 3 family protein [Lautropia sp.]